MSKSFFLITLLAVSMGTASAFAYDESAAGPGDPAPVKYEDLRKHCASQGKEGKGGSPGEQLPVKNPYVSCSDSYVSWVQADPGTVMLPGSRSITTSLKDKFFYIPQSGGSMQVAQKGGSCTRFKEVNTTVNLETPITCDQVLAYDNLVDFCAQIVDSKKGGGSKLGDTVETGRVIDTCGSGSIGKGKP